MDLSERITVLCYSKKISRRKLESDLGLSNGATSKWGKSSPSGETLLKVARYFDMPIEKLLGEEGTFKTKPTTSEGQSVDLGDI